MGAVGSKPSLGPIGGGGRGFQGRGNILVAFGRKYKVLGNILAFQTY